MGEDKDIYALTADLGYKAFDKIKEDYPYRFYNLGASEQCMLATAVGLAHNGKKVFCYSITPFLLYRPFEIIRTYINEEKTPVCLIGSGRNDDYKHDGFSHYAGDDALFMDNFTKIKSRWPKDSEEMEGYVRDYLHSAMPYYINLSR